MKVIINENNTVIQCKREPTYDVLTLLPSLNSLLQSDFIKSLRLESANQISQNTAAVPYQHNNIIISFWKIDSLWINSHRDYTTSRSVENWRSIKTNCWNSQFQVSSVEYCNLCGIEAAAAVNSVGAYGTHLLRAVCLWIHENILPSD